MSIQLILSHYLAGLRERHELDALLPELLKAMGHIVHSRPQTGVNQAGVDVLSVCSDDGDGEVVYLFVIKFGDLGRNDFYGGQQSIDPSIREVANDYIRNRLPAEFAGLRRKIVLLTNGFLKQEAQVAFVSLSKDIAERLDLSCQLEFWGADKLTPLIEKHLFDETLLLSSGKSDLRAALAGERNPIRDSIDLCVFSTLVFPFLTARLKFSNERQCVRRNFCVGAPRL